MSVFIVQLRNPATRMWGNQAEVTADTAQQAADSAAGYSLHASGGTREELRARVWEVPFGSKAEMHFYDTAQGRHEPA
jgi:hypothetical protein